LGTLREYANAEGGGLMSDREEGRGVRSFVGDIINRESFWWNGRLVTMGRVTGFPRSISFVNETDGNLFCASKGGYDHQRHYNILNGKGDYGANEGYTAFVELDVYRLRKAILLLKNTVLAGRVIFENSDVVYASRETLYPPSRLKNVVSAETEARHALSTVFTKPERFSLEQEHRFALVPVGHTSETLLTKKMAPHIQTAFREAIHSEGRANI
jgi:hypothetical protein